MNRLTISLGSTEHMLTSRRICLENFTWHGGFISSPRPHDKVSATTSPLRSGYLVLRFHSSRKMPWYIHSRKLHQMFAWNLWSAQRWRQAACGHPSIWQSSPTPKSLSLPWFLPYKGSFSVINWRPPALHPPSQIRVTQPLNHWFSPRLN